MNSINIAGRAIGDGHPAFIIAEIGFNHEGDVELGKRMIEAAAQAGTDAVKFQTYKADELSLVNHPHYGLIKQGELDEAQHRALARTAADCGVVFLSTPFSPWAVELLAGLDVPAYKVASMDVTYEPMLRLIGARKRPVILSTGMATLSEVAGAVDVLRHSGASEIVLMHCISHYPPNPANANIRTISQLGCAFDLPVGYSDHLLSNAAAIASIAFGACMIEKHFTTDKNLPGPDHKISLDPHELRQLVSDIRIVEAALGRACLDETRPDRPQARLSRRGVYASQAIVEGTALEERHIKCVRPASALPPALLSKLVGRSTRRALADEEAFDFDAI